MTLYRYPVSQLIGFLSVAIAVLACSQIVNPSRIDAARVPAILVGTVVAVQDAEEVDQDADEVAKTEVASDDDLASDDGLQSVQAEVSSQDLGSEHFLPQTTKAWLSLSSLNDLAGAVSETQMGKLAQDPDLSPVVDSINSQLTEWMDQRNVKFALNMEKLNTLSDGEICFAGILNKVGAQAETVRHAIVILADTRGHKLDVERLLEDVEKDLTVRGATKTELEIHGLTTTRWDFKKPKGIASRESAFFAVVSDRLVACDDQAIFAEVVAAILDPTSQQNSLAKHEAFMKIRERCLSDDSPTAPQIKWFIEPFGYVELTDAMREKNRKARLDASAAEPREVAAILERQGFAAAKASGGDITFAVNGLDMIHRGFVYAPPKADGSRFEKAAQMLDFSNSGSEINVESWVPGSAATCATVHWDFVKGLDGIGLLFDEFTKPGNWATVVDGWKKGRQGIKFDVYGLVPRLDGKITFLSDFEEPIVEGSERIVVGIKIKPEEGNEDWISSELDSFFKPQKSNWKAVPFTGRRTIWKAEKKADNSDNELDGLLDDLDDLDTPKDKEQIEEPLFPEQYILVANNNIFFSNDLTYLKKVAEDSSSPLNGSDELKLMNDKLDELSPAIDSMRQFGRVDRSVKFVYELLRKNKMPRDNSLFAKVLKNFKEGDMAKKIDGSKLPQDFENVVAPFLGLSGWSVETEEDGWFFIAAILPRPKASLTTVPETVDK